MLCNTAGTSQPQATGAAVEGAKIGKAALKRQRIIDAAAAVFRRRGYAQATLSEIATEAGTQAGSLYYYFDSREQLVEEVLTYSMLRLRARVSTAVAQLPPEADALDRLVTVIRTQVLCVLNRDDYEIAYQKIHDQVTDDMRDRIAHEARAFARYWTTILEAAMQEGFLRPDLDLRLTRLLLIGSISWMADWYKNDGPARPDEIADAVLRLFFNGVAVDRDAIVGRIAPPKPAARRRAASRKSKISAPSS
ncbi:MAG: transcriptional regulator, TetR family [Sphingomonadales bacterium]|nr:transcriptional regulator, TetR family [Sphingomonadales bacterium]